MTEQHTPGPWYVEVLDDTSRLSLPNGPIYMVLGTVKGYPSTVCSVEEYCEVPGFNAPRLADVKLIAAAPELLNALKYIVQGEDAGFRDEPSIYNAVIEKARAAIAKAIGGAE